ncbi:MAG: hypothetical protein HOP03_17230 [Lysobacter sp.]|nr:hypothetical protein [Lysobacter sp.]
MIRPRFAAYLLTIATSLFMIDWAAAAEATESSPKHYQLNRLALLQPESLIGKRVAVKDIVATTNAITSIAERWSSGLDTGRAANDCAIFVALRPKKRIKTWTSCKTFEATELDILIANEMQAKRIPRVSGLVLFAMHGKSSDENAFPDAWKTGLDGTLKTVAMSDIVDRIWPE